MEKGNKREMSRPVKRIDINDPTKIK